MTPTGRTCPSTPAALDPITTGWTQWPGQLFQNRTWKEDSASSWKLSFLSFSAKLCIWCYRGTFYFFFLPKGQRWKNEQENDPTLYSSWNMEIFELVQDMWGEKDTQRIKGKYEGITDTTDTSAPLLQFLKFRNLAFSLRQANWIYSLSPEVLDQKIAYSVARLLLLKQRKVSIMQGVPCFVNWWIN